jgi:hypothetical protein
MFTRSHLTWSPRPNIVRTDNLRSRLPGKRTEPDEAKCVDTRLEKAAKGERSAVCLLTDVSAPVARDATTPDRF